MKKTAKELAHQFARLPRNAHLWSAIEIARYAYEQGVNKGLRVAEREQRFKLKTT